MNQPHLSPKNFYHSYPTIEIDFTILYKKIGHIILERSITMYPIFISKFNPQALKES